MYNPRIYAAGFESVFKATWTVRLETPLAIRNGLKVSMSETEGRKTRGQGVKVAWTPGTGDTEHDVAALHFGYEVQGGQVVAKHQVPASSVRGALRSWTINRLVTQPYRALTRPAPKTTEEQDLARVAQVRDALADPTGGLPMIASLFGQALDTRDEADLSNAGRLRIETEPFESATPRPIAVDGNPGTTSAGPSNVHRQLTVRNPLDRVTQASRKGGLHHFLEFCKGEHFVLRLTVFNPVKQDLALVSLWRRELEAGMLRLGALASIGRGRVSIAAARYQVWLRTKAVLEPWPVALEAAAPTVGEALDTFVDAFEIPAESLHLFESVLTPA